MNIESHVLEQGGRWIHAKHTEWCDSYPNWTRPYHLEMPLLTESLAPLMDYPFHEELAFCLSIAFAEGADYGLARFEGYCKAALFLTRQMLHFWDVRQEGVPIFIGVSENGLQGFREFAEHCDFPESHVVTLPSYQDMRDGWNIKFDMWAAPGLAKFQRRLHIDASAWLRQTASRQPCKMLLSEWQEQEYLLRRPKLLMGTPRQTAMSRVFRHARPGFFEALANLLGTDAEEELCYWQREGVEHVHGFLYGLSQPLWEESSALVKSLCQITPNDEVVLAILARELQWAKRERISDAGMTYFEDLVHVPAFARRTSAAAAMDFMQTWRKAHGYDPRV